MFCLLGLYLTAPSLGWAFTLDAQAPVIKKGAPDSYFGYSVSQHLPQAAKPNPSILVGAPLDQNLQPDSKRSGALWRCPITMLEDDCQQIPLDGKVPGSSSSEILMPPRSGENKTEQWLGVTVNSQGGKVITCAHRYIADMEFGFGQGLCYTLTPALELDDIWEPCKGRPTKRPLEEFGYCQAGTSASMLGNWTILGSPGPYTARGTTFLMDTLDDFLLRDKMVYHAPLSPSPVDKYSYLGMSVTGFESKEGPVVVGGAPRALRGKGAVLLFSIEQTSTPVLETLLTLDGEESHFSNFGYEVALADVNGDRRPDLLVGAPEYFEEDKIGGAVFIFFNKNNKFSKEESLKLTRGGHESRFGLAISSCGDLNKDGFDDFAVGAPYDTGGTGKVYIYLGSGDGDIKQPSQELNGDKYGVMSLGLSLSGGGDLDGNGMPDLLAGAGDAVLAFRGRTLVPILTTVGPPEALTNIDPNTCFRKSSTNPCFRIEICLSMNATEELVIYYTLKGDIAMALPRVFFTGTETKESNLKKGKLFLKPEPDSGIVRHCSNYTVYIRREQRHLRKPIEFRISYSLPDGSGAGPLPGAALPALGPQLDPAMALKYFEATYSKDCGQICLSDLRIQYTLSLPKDKTTPDGSIWRMIVGQDTEVYMELTVNNFGMHAYDAKLKVQHDPSISFIGITTSQKHSYSENTVLCELGDPLEKQVSLEVGIRFSLKEVRYTSLLEAFTVTATTTSVMTEPKPKLDILLRPYLHYFPPTVTGTSRPHQLVYSGEIAPTVAFKDDFGSKVEHLFNVTNQGETTLYKTNLTILWPYVWTEDLDDRPQSPILNKLLYIVEPPIIIGATGDCSPLEGLVNPLGLPDEQTIDEKTSDNDTLNRRKRDTEGSAVQSIKSAPKKIIELSCDEVKVYCFHIYCSIDLLEPGKEASVVIKARISNATLHYLLGQHYHDVYISSRVVLLPNITDNVFTGGLPTKFMAKAQTMAVLQKIEEKVSLWVYIMSGILGVMVLGILVIILMFCGFFRRLHPKEEAEIDGEEIQELTEAS